MLMKYNNLLIKSISLGLITMSAQASKGILDISIGGVSEITYAVAPGASLPVTFNVQNNTPKQAIYTATVPDGVTLPSNGSDNACPMKGQNVTLDPSGHCTIKTIIDTAKLFRLRPNAKDLPYPLENPLKLCPHQANNFGCYTSITRVSFSTTNSPLIPSVSTLALSVNNTDFNAALTGNPRQITISLPVGGVQLISVTYPTTLSGGITVSAPIAASGSLCSLSTSTTMNPGDACVFTITPSSTAKLNDTFTLSGIDSSNPTTTYSVGVGVNVLSYGSNYQGGYVFAIDDTTPSSGSVGGKVVATQAAQPTLYTNGVSLGTIWSSSGTYPTGIHYVGPVPASTSNCTGSYPTPNLSCASADAIPGINENSTTPTDICNGAEDGACNSTQILNYYQSLPTPNSDGHAATKNYDDSDAYYAAGVCKYADSTWSQSQSDWYLPSICELGYYVDTNCQLSTETTICTQNMQSILSLYYTSFPGFPDASKSPFNFLNGNYWSSTQYSGDQGGPNNEDAWYQYFTPPGTPGVESCQAVDKKADASLVVCVRKLT